MMQVITPAKEGKQRLDALNGEEAMI